MNPMVLCERPLNPFDATQTSFVKDDHRHMNLSRLKLEDYFNKLIRYEPLFKHFNDQSKAQVSLRFCISHAACQTAIPGAKTALQVKENSSSSGLGPIPAHMLKSLIPGFYSEENDSV